MEKFGEWKRVIHFHDWKQNSRATWEVEVHTPGYHNVDLTYSGEGRLVWKVDVEGGEKIQNQQNASHNYQQFPIGWIKFEKPGRYKISVSCIEGNIESASLQSIRLTPIE